MEEEQEFLANIKVIGVGGGGSNAVDRMIKSGINGVHFIVTNTDLQALKMSCAPEKIQIGCRLTKGLGAGAIPEVGQKAATEDGDKLKQTLDGADMVFITAGLGGGTGTGAAPVIAEIAKGIGALTVAIVTKPFTFEGRVRAKHAEMGLTSLKEKADTVITIPNEKLFSVVDKNTSLIEAFTVADNVLRQGVQSIANLVTQPGLVNVDFADVRTIMKGTGGALMGVGVGRGEERALSASQSAIRSPLLDEVSIDGATGVLVNITGAPDLSLSEVDSAMKVIYETADPEANIIFGVVIDDSLQDEIRITVIATGFNAKAEASLSQQKKPPLSLENYKMSKPTRSRKGHAVGGIQAPPDKNSSPGSDLDIPTFLRMKAD